MCLLLSSWCGTKVSFTSYLAIWLFCPRLLPPIPNIVLGCVMMWTPASWQPACEPLFFPSPLNKVTSLHLPMRVLLPVLQTPTGTVLVSLLIPSDTPPCQYKAHFGPTEDVKLLNVIQYFSQTFAHCSHSNRRKIYLLGTIFSSRWIHTRGWDRITSEYQQPHR